MESRAAMIIAELTQAHELAKKLGALLKHSQIEFCRTIAGDIVYSIEKAIRTANTCSVEHEFCSNGGGQFVETEKKISKKRKKMENWRNQVRVNCEGGAEMPNDGRSWRKYGQKDILGAKYPRAYYRCTHRKTQGCSAMKQVQKLDENPSVLDITYLGNHTCSNPQSKFHLEDRPHRPIDQQHSLILLEPSPESLDFQNQCPDSSLSSPSIAVDGTEPDNHFFCSSAIMSPATSGSNCLPLPPCDFELEEIISAAMFSEIESPPVMDVDFVLQYGSIGVDMHYDTSIFFV